MADTISFARGAPSLDIVDVEGLREAAQLAFERDPAGTTAYGTSVGYVPLREYIAELHEVDVDQVLVTNGSMQADAFLFQLLVSAGESVVVESPTYDRTLLNLRNRGADIHMVALETDGIDVDGLEVLLRDEGVRPTLAHVIPNFQNPAGYTLSAGKRARLLALAAEYDFTIFEDDPYIWIRFEGEGLPTMLSQDEAGKVVYASSFSKTVAPGLRAGYMVLPPRLVAPLEELAVSTTISPVLVGQATIMELIRRGRFEPNLARVCGLLRERRDAMLGALAGAFPDGACWSRPEGGYFLWLELDGGRGARHLAYRAEAEGVAFVCGEDFFPSSSAGGVSSARLAFSYETPARIREGIGRLALLI